MKTITQYMAIRRIAIEELEKLIKSSKDEVDAVSILLDRERHKVAEAYGVLEQIVLAAEAGESIPTDILDAARKLIDQ